METIVVMEVTDWGYNHKYLLSKSKQKCLGYWPWGTGDFVSFSKPLSFNPARRKFKKVED